MHYYKKVHSFGNQRTELKVHRRFVAMKPVLDAPLGTVNLNFQSSTPALTNWMIEAIPQSPAMHHIFHLSQTIHSANSYSNFASVTHPLYPAIR